jgi:hypothetical protein
MGLDRRWRTPLYHPSLFTAVTKARKDAQSTSARNKTKRYWDIATASAIKGHRRATARQAFLRDVTTDNGDVRHVNKEECKEEIGERAMLMKMVEAEKELASAEVAQAKAAEVLAAAKKGEGDIADAARVDLKTKDAAANVAKEELVAAQGIAWLGDIDFDDKVKLETHLRDFKNAEAEEKKAAEVAALVTAFYQEVGLDKMESNAVIASDWRKVFCGTSLVCNVVVDLLLVFGLGPSCTFAH